MLGCLDDAEPLYVQVPQARRRTRGDDDGKTLSPTVDLALLHAARRRLAEAASA